MGIVQRRRKTETRALLLEAGLGVFAERGIEVATLDEVAETAGFTKGAIYRQFPSKGAFLLGLFEQYAAVARAGSGARQAAWFVPLTIQFAAQAMRDPLLRRRFAIVLAEAPEGRSVESDLLKALARVLPPSASPAGPPPST
jgi:AcrR family transcriptional regulator